MFKSKEDLLKETYPGENSLTHYVTVEEADAHSNYESGLEDAFKSFSERAVFCKKYKDKPEKFYEIFGKLGFFGRLGFFRKRKFIKVGYPVSLINRIEKIGIR